MLVDLIVKQKTVRLKKPYCPVVSPNFAQTERQVRLDERKYELKREMILSGAVWRFSNQAQEA